MAPAESESASVSVIRYSNVALDDPNFERTHYEPFIAYGRSKTANILTYDEPQTLAT